MKLFLITLLFCTLITDYVKANDDKIRICHVPKGDKNNPVDITIDKSSWKIISDIKSPNYGRCPNHLSKGDHCPNGHGGDYTLSNNGRCLNENMNESVLRDFCVSTLTSNIIENDDVVICHRFNNKLLELKVKRSKLNRLILDDGDYIGKCGPPIGSRGWNITCKPTLVCTRRSGIEEEKLISIYQWKDNTSCNLLENNEYSTSCGDTLGSCKQNQIQCNGVGSKTYVNLNGEQYCSCDINNLYTGSCVGNECYCTPCKLCNHGICLSDNFRPICQCDQGWENFNVSGTFEYCRSEIIGDDGCLNLNSIIRNVNEYDVFASDYFYGKNSYIEGKLASDKVTLHDYSIGDKYASNNSCGEKYPYLLTNILKFSDAEIKGNVMYSVINSINNLDKWKTPCSDYPGNYDEDKPLSFDLGSYSIKRLSNILSQHSKDTLNLIEKSSSIDIYLNTKEFQVANIKSKPNKIKHINLIDEINYTLLQNPPFVSDDMVILLNIEGKNLVISDWKFNEVFYNKQSNIIWNFYQAEHIHFDGVNFAGTIIAPYAKISGNNAIINGQVWCSTVIGSIKFKHNPFKGCIKNNFLNMNKCFNTCPTNSYINNDTCECQCLSNDCSEGKVFNSKTCDCDCQISCPIGTQADENCTCQSCGDPPSNAIWTTNGGCIPMYVRTCPHNSVNLPDPQLNLISKSYVDIKHSEIGGRIMSNSDIAIDDSIIGTGIFNGSYSKCPNDVNVIISSGNLSLSNSLVLYGNIVSKNYFDIKEIQVTPQCIWKSYSKQIVNRSPEKLFNEFISFSKYLSKLKSTSRHRNNIIDGVLTLYGSGDNKYLEVFNIDYQDLYAAQYIVLSDIYPKATIIINIKVSSADNRRLPSGQLLIDKGGKNIVGLSKINLDSFIGAEDKTIWNFNDASELILDNIIFRGSLLAPSAQLKQLDSEVIGQVAVDSYYSQYSSISYVPFGGCLSDS